MLRIILGVIAGFVVWSILWVGLGEVLSLILPDWYGKTSSDFRSAVAAQTPYALSSGVLIWLLVQSVICSLIAGYVAALIARENVKSTLLLGILLLFFGIFVQSTHWNYMPLWYHIPFLLLLIPMTIMGGKLKKLKR